MEALTGMVSGSLLKGSRASKLEHSCAKCCNVPDLRFFLSDSFDSLNAAEQLKLRREYCGGIYNWRDQYLKGQITLDDYNANYEHVWRSVKDDNYYTAVSTKDPLHLLGNNWDDTVIGELSKMNAGSALKESLVTEMFDFETLKGTDRVDYFRKTAAGQIHLGFRAKWRRLKIRQTSSDIGCGVTIYPINSQTRDYIQGGSIGEVYKPKLTGDYGPFTTKAYNVAGTLGKGNHFIEVVEGKDNQSWLAVHTGSRGLWVEYCWHQGDRFVNRQDIIMSRICVNFAKRQRHLIAERVCGHPLPKGDDWIHTQFVQQEFVKGLWHRRNNKVLLLGSPGTGFGYHKWSKHGGWLPHGTGKIPGKAEYYPLPTKQKVVCTRRSVVGLPLKVTSPKYIGVLYIPSGGGKTVLAKKYKWLVDPDSIPGMETLSKVEPGVEYSKEFWKQRNEKIRRFISNYNVTGKVLMLWTPSLLPDEIRQQVNGREMAIVTQQPNIRMGAQNIRDLRNQAIKFRIPIVDVRISELEGVVTRRMTHWLKGDGHSEGRKSAPYLGWHVFDSNIVLHTDFPLGISEPEAYDPAKPYPTISAKSSRPFALYCTRAEYKQALQRSGGIPVVIGKRDDFKLESGHHSYYKKHYAPSPSAENSKESEFLTRPDQIRKLHPNDEEQYTARGVRANEKNARFTSSWPSGTIKMQVLEDTVDFALRQGHSTLKRLINNWYPIDDSGVRERTRVQASLLAKICLDGRIPEAKNYLRYYLPRCLGMGGQGLAILVLYSISSNERGIFIKKMVDCGFTSRGGGEWAKDMKELHNMIRRSDTVPSWLNTKLEAEDLMYLDCAAGRYMDLEAATDSTVADRQMIITHKAKKPDGKRSKTYHRRLMKEQTDKIAEVFVKGIEDVVNDAHDRGLDFSPEDWHAQYIINGATGSASTGKKELEHLDFARVPHKRMWLNEISTEDLLRFDQLPLTTECTCAIKTELAKLRQLLPGPVWHWLVETLLLSMSELKVYREHDQVYMEKDAISRLSLLKKKEEEVRDSIAGFKAICAVDYKDFNITHSYEDMAQLWDSVRHKLDAIKTDKKDWFGHSLAEHLQKACEYLISQFDSMFARLAGGTGAYEQLTRGLWSGWRSTSYINIMFNYCYASIINHTSNNSLGHEILQRFESMGDDVHAVTATIEEALQAICMFEESGHELQASKQLIGRKAEFLRVTYRSTGVRGNLMRTVGSFVGSDMQSPPVVNGPEYVKGTGAAIGGMWRRGFDQKRAQILIDICGKYFASVRHPDGSERKLNNTKWLYVTEESGGWGLPILGELGPSNTGSKPPFERPKAPRTRTGAKDHGVNALVEHARRIFNHANIRQDELELLKDDAKRATYDGALDTKGLMDYQDLQRKHQDELIQFHNSTEPQLRFDWPSLNRNETSVIKSVIRKFTTDTSDEILEYDAIDIEQLIESAVASSLGVLGTSRQLLTQLHDTNGTKLTIYEAMDRLNPSKPGYRKLFSAAKDKFGVRLTTWLASSSAHILNDNGQIVAPDLLPLVHQVHTAVIPVLRQRLGDETLMNDVNGWLRQVNLTIIHYYKTYGLNDRYKM